jgi:beta-lactam-binding protein with PASTA domain
VKRARKVLAAADCAVGKIKKAKGAPRPKKERVRSQNPGPGARVSDTAPIRLIIGSKT